MGRRAEGTAKHPLPGCLHGRWKSSSSSTSSIIISSLRRTETPLPGLGVLHLAFDLPGTCSCRQHGRLHGR